MGEVAGVGLWSAGCVAMCPKDRTGRGSDCQGGFLTDDGRRFLLDPLGEAAPGYQSGGHRGLVPDERPSAPDRGGGADMWNGA
jgi:hypothetical protein